MPAQITDLQPRSLWHYFAELSKIPRGSKKEQAAIDWAESVARARGAETVRDGAGNLLVRVPASPGCEQAPTVVLQGHVDMVCEKNSDVVHDFERDPIVPVVDGEFVVARGTTLGADNGIGVAAALAFLDERESPHGPLELLFTVDEETGLSGAFAIQPGFMSGSYLINLDSEKIGVFTVGCAGGRDTTITFRAPRNVAPADTLLRLQVSGLQGGHSGTDIHKNRGSSIRILFRLLLAAAEDPRVGALRLGVAQGGSKRNAIAREARAIVGLNPDRHSAFRAAIDAEVLKIREQLAGIDDGLRIDLAPGLDAPGAAATPESALIHVCNPQDSLRFIRLMNALPHGVQGMSAEIPDLVETSCNIGVLADLGTAYQVSCSGRSSVAPALLGLLAQIRSAAALAGAEAEHSDGYPGWKPNLKSPLLARAKDVHRRLFGADAEVRAIHAGLECGLFTEKYPRLDILSYGPEIEGAHSPDERVRIVTVERMWDFTKALLADLSQVRA